MRVLRSCLLAVSAVILPGAAVAADMPYGRGPALIGESDPLEEEIGTGWYLRGDVGFGRATGQTFTMAATDYSAGGRGGAFGFGAGFGYKFNDWLRADLTVDQVTSFGLKRRIGTVACNTTNTCTIDRGYDGTLMPIMANAYLDFGNWAGFSPYVGGGGGAAQMTTGGTFAYTDTTTAAVVSTSVTTRSKWTPALAAMAGLTVDLGSGIQLDAGYRYLWLTDGSTGARAQNGAGAAVPATAGFGVDGIHQARVGLRYFVN